MRPWSVWGLVHTYSREHAGRWGTASAQVLSGRRRVGFASSARGVLGMEGCIAEVQDEQIQDLNEMLLCQGGWRGEGDEERVQNIIEPGVYRVFS